MLTASREWIGLKIIKLHKIYIKEAILNLVLNSHHGERKGTKMAKISCRDVMFLDRIKSGLLYLIHLR